MGAWGVGILAAEVHVGGAEMVTLRGGDEGLG